MKAAKWLLAPVMSAALVVAPYLPVAVVVPVAVSQSACNTSWIQTALNDLPVLIQIATSILGIVSAAQGQNQVDAATAATIANVGNQIKLDLQTVQSLVTSYQSAASTAKPGILSQIDTALSAVQTNLQALLSAFHVSNAALQSTISTAIALAETTVLAIQSLVPATPSPAPASKIAHASGPIKPMTAHQLKSAYNAVLSSNGYAQFAI